MAHRAVRPVLAAAMVAATVPVIASAQASPAVVAEHVRHVVNVPGSTGGHSVIEGDRLYVGAYGLGMRLFDIKDPAAPKVLGQFFPGPQSGAPDNDLGARADAVPDAAVIDGRHIVTLSGTGRTAGTQQTEFVDWTDPAAPKVLHRFTNAADGEAHNGDIVDARRTFFASGSVNLRIYDLNPLLGATPAAPAPIANVNPLQLWKDSPHRGERAIGGGSSSIHDIEVYTDRQVLLPQAQWTDTTGDGVPDKTYAKRDIALLAEGGAYLTGNNTGSLYIIDVTDPANPVALLRYQRPAGKGKAVRYVHEAQFLAAQPDVIVTTDEDLHNGCDAGGIVTHRVSEDLTQIEELAQWFIGTGSPSAVCSTHVMSTKGNFAFIGSYNAGLQVVDLSDPAKPRTAGKYIAAGANSWGALVHPTAPGFLTYVGDFGARGLDVLEFVPPGVSEACQGRDIALAPGERLVSNTVWLHGTAPVGNADGVQDLTENAASRLFMDEKAPTSSSHKVYAGLERGAPTFSGNPLLGYWNQSLTKKKRVVCAEAVVYAATAGGNLTLQLWNDGGYGAGATPAATTKVKAAGGQVTAYRANFGPLDVTATSDLLLQAVHEAPGSLLYYDSTSRPSWLTYVTVEKG